MCTEAVPIVSCNFRQRMNLRRKYDTNNLNAWNLPLKIVTVASQYKRSLPKRIDQCARMDAHWVTFVKKMKNYFLQHHFLRGPSQQKSPHWAHHHSAQPGTARGAFGGSNMVRPCKALRASWLEEGSTDPEWWAEQIASFVVWECNGSHLDLPHLWITKSGNQSNTI